MRLRYGALAPILSGGLAVGVAGATLAKDAGSCPAGQGYDLLSLAALDARYPGAGGYAAFRDNNGDGLVCVKVTAKPNPHVHQGHPGFADNNK
jgi:hypothetical protein